MKTKALWHSIVVAVFMSPVAVLAQYTSKPIVDTSTYMQAPRKYTGITTNPYNSCSGAVVADTRIMLSASHCAFKEELSNPWIASPEWHLRYASANYPTAGQGKATRGYWYFTSYADAVRAQGMSSREAFDLDYMVVFSHAPLAEEAAPYFKDGVGAILNLPWKQTVGYPSGLYKGANPYKYYMHQNGPWTAQCQVERNSYIGCVEVSAGAGNSGGPVFVWDEKSSTYGYAGVFVSGLERSGGDPIDSSGINAMSQDEWPLVTSAIDSANKEPPDNGGGGSGGNNGPAPVTTPAPQLKIYGNNSFIPSGQKSTYRVDMTDFGSVTGSKTVTRTFSFINTGNAPLSFVSNKPVTLAGKGARYFRVRTQLAGQTLAPNQTQRLAISFRAAPRGRHRSSVVVRSNDPKDSAYRFVIQGNRR